MSNPEVFNETSLKHVNSVAESPFCEFEDAVRNIWYPNALAHGFWNSATEDTNGQLTINAFEMDYTSSIRGRVNSKIISEIVVADNPCQTTVTIKKSPWGYKYIADKANQDIRFYTCTKQINKSWEGSTWHENTEPSAQYKAESMHYWLVGPGSCDYVFVR